MLIGRRSGTVAMALLAAACADPSRSPSLPPDVEQQILAEAEAAAAARSPMIAREKFGAVIVSVQFDSLPAAERHRALFGAGWTALQLEKPQEAQADFLRSSAMPESILNDHLGLLVASLLLHDWRAVCQALTRIARGDPVTFDSINDEVVFG